MRRFAIVAGALALSVACWLVINRPAPTDWRKITTHFSGFTNLLGAEVAVIDIKNSGPKSIMLRDLTLEYVGIPPYAPIAGSPNVMRDMPPGTNLVIASGREGAFLIPTPDQGTSWIAHLEFAPSGMLTAVGEKLIRSTNAMARALPVSIGHVPVRGVPVHFVDQAFHK